jgi:predicted nucleic acid-binding protein
LLAANIVATTGMIRLELLRGARSQQHFNQLEPVLSGLHQLPTAETTWEEAARLGLQLRVAGLVVQAPDLVVASVALRNRCVLLHRHRDFDLIAQHTPLQVESYV